MIMLQGLYDLDFLQNIIVCSNQDSKWGIAYILCIIDVTLLVFKGSLCYFDRVSVHSCCFSFFQFQTFSIYEVQIYVSEFYFFQVPCWFEDSGDKYCYYVGWPSGSYSWTGHKLTGLPTKVETVKPT